MSSRSRCLRKPHPAARSPGLAACASLLALAGCESVPPWTPASARTSDDVVQAIAYAGPVLPLSQVATIYSYDGGDGGEAGWICSVDGHELQRRSGLAVHCPSVVYVTPGAHVIGWQARGPGRRGSPRGQVDAADAGTLRVQAMPGGVYRLVPDEFRRTTLAAMRPGGGALRYADINPAFASTALPYPPAQ